MLSDLGYKIFVDRYARKTHNNFVIGDKVLVKYSGQSLFGTVLSLSKDSVQVKLENGDDIGCDKSNVTKPIETVDEMFWRVAKSVATVESEKEHWTCKFFDLLSLWKFIPGGRILSAAAEGVGHAVEGVVGQVAGVSASTNLPLHRTEHAGEQNLTYYNCFVLPSPKDCREGIILTLQQMVEIMSRGGGVGINISSLRPKDSHVRGVSGRSSGAVSWGALYRKPKASVSAANMLCYWVDLSRWLKKGCSGIGAK